MASSNNSSGGAQRPMSVVVRRSRKGDHGGHHGGAWKIAYADFVTAMMAFFLLMWLLSSTSKYDRQGIEDYFNTPLSVLLGGHEGSGAARPSVVNGGGRDLSKTDPGVDTKSQTAPAPASTPDAAAAAEKVRLAQLQAQLTALIEQDPVLRNFKDQIRISITSEGLRIEIVDSQKRPMFATGSSALQPYADTILNRIGNALNGVVNRISIAGHTDAVAYAGGQAGFTNWELSAERANAARRALAVGGMHEDKLLQVRGLADVLPLDSHDANAPTNRRISILVMNQAAVDAFFRDGGRETTVSAQAGGALPGMIGGGAAPVARAVTVTAKASS